MTRVRRRSFLGAVCGPLAGGEEERPLRTLTEFMDEDAETAGGVAEAAGRFGRGKPLHEEGAKGFVLAVGRVGRLEEPVGRVC